MPISWPSIYSVGRLRIRQQSDATQFTGHWELRCHHYFIVNSSSFLDNPSILWKSFKWTRMEKTINNDCKKTHFILLPSLPSKYIFHFFASKDSWSCWMRGRRMGQQPIFELYWNGCWYWILNWTCDEQRWWKRDILLIYFIIFSFIHSFIQSVIVLICDSFIHLLIDGFIIYWSIYLVVINLNLFIRRERRN